MKYQLFQCEPGEPTHLVAMEAGSELALNCDLPQVALIDATPYVAFSPGSSAFQSNQTNEYVKTDLAWPQDIAVVVH